MRQHREIMLELYPKYIETYWDMKANPTEENKKTFETVCFEVLEELMRVNAEILKKLKTI